MIFSFLETKRNINFYGIIIIFTCFSCQNLNQTRKPVKTRGQAKSSPVLIDKNYFEHNAFLNYLKAESASFKSDRTTALKHFKKARLFAPKSTYIQKRIAEIYEKEGLLASAVNEYKKLIKTSANKKEFIEKLTNLYALQQLNDQALEQNDLLLKKYPHSFPLILKKAVLLINQENWAEALKTLKKAENKADLLEETVQSLLFQAYILAKQNKIKNSMEIISQIRKLDFPEEDLILKIVDFYKSFDAQTAWLYLEDFQRKKGATIATSTALLNEAISSQNWEKASHHIQQLEDLGAMKEQHYFYSALFFIKEKQYNKATLYLKDLITQNPQSGHYNYLLALNYEKSKQWPKAVKAYQTVPSNSPYFLTAHLQLAQLWQKQGKYKKSFKLLNYLAFNNPASPQAILLYAESLWNIGNKKKALHTLTKALKHHPQHVDILFLRGLYLKQTGAIDLALKDLNQILKIQVNHNEALKLIASLTSKNI